MISRLTGVAVAAATLTITALPHAIGTPAATNSLALDSTSTVPYDEWKNHTVEVMTYNVHGGKTGPVPQLNWENTKSYVVALINKNDPDIFALQEISGTTGSAHTVEWVNPQFAAEYDYYQPPTGSPKMIYFKQSRFTVVKNADGTDRSGVIKMETPTGGCEPEGYRTMSWVMLRDGLRNTNVFVANAHLAVVANPGSSCLQARLESVEEIHAELKRANPENAPMAIMGDWNNRSPHCVGATEGEPLTNLTEVPDGTHSYRLTPTQTLRECQNRTNTGETTWAAGGVEVTSAAAIDHIFYNVGRMRRNTHVVDRSRTVPLSGGGHASPSDHYPVISTLVYEADRETTVPELQYGHSGNAVETVQHLLNHHGASLTVDGSFGPSTQAAVSDFQTAQGIAASGVVDDATWDRLLPTVAPNSSSDAVRALQHELNGAAAELAVDGNFGPATQAALKSYQTAAGMPAETTATWQTWGSLID